MAHHPVQGPLSLARQFIVVLGFEQILLRPADAHPPGRRQKIQDKIIQRLIQDDLRFFDVDLKGLIQLVVKGKFDAQKAEVRLL